MAKIIQNQNSCLFGAKSQMQNHFHIFYNLKHVSSLRKISFELNKID